MEEEVKPQPETKNTSEVKPSFDLENTSEVSMSQKISLHKWKILAGLLGVLVFAGAVFGSYKFGQRQARPELVEGPTPIPEAVATPTPDSTANWKTYTNTKYGYSIKYPSETKVQESPGYEERIQETIFTLFGPKYQGPGEFTDGFGITLAVIKNPNNKTPTQFAQEYYQQSGEDINNKILEGDISKCKVENVVRNNTSGARFTYCTQAPGSGILNFSEWYVKNGVTFQIYAVLQNEDYLTTFNLMLSTFRFLEEGDLRVWVEDWNEYANDVYGYAFQYPPAFSLTDRSVMDRSQIEISRDEEKITIRASREKETPYYLDEESSGETELGGSLAKIYRFPNGYCDGPSCSPPFVAVVTRKGENKYVMEFYQTTEISGIYQQILSTFRFLE